ncbi:MAG: polysaccharide deacetylase family protein [Pyrinomonadaceae bacterium]
MLINHLRRIVPASWKRAATDHDFWFRARVNLLAKPLYAGIGSILAFHRVCPRGARPRLGFNKDLEVTPELLEQSIKFCKNKGYDLVSLDQAYEILRTGKSAKKFVVFTLDDGYLDNYTNAYPIFKKHSVPFTIYVTTCFPEYTAILWWYVLEELLWEREEVEVELENKVVRYDCSTPGKKEQLFEMMAGPLTFAKDEAALRGILRDCSSDVCSQVQELALSWQQIAQLAQDPLITIGAHSRRHLALSKLSLEEVKAEVSGSKREVEKQIGQPVLHFAYPYGGNDAAGAREFQIVKDCGFKTATTTRTGNIFSSHKDSLVSLPRIPVHEAELQKGIEYLNLWLDGLVPCHENSFARVMTV